MFKPLTNLIYITQLTITILMFVSLSLLSVYLFHTILGGELEGEVHYIKLSTQTKNLARECEFR